MSSPWLRVISARSGQAKQRLVLFHHAGGSSLSFAKWSALVPDDVEVLLAELPGRGARSREKILVQFDEASDGLTRALEGFVDLPLFLFGHSLGALLAFDGAQNLSARVQIVGVSSFLPPTVANLSARHPISDLSDQDFIRTLLDYSLLPDEVLKNQEALDFFLPILRADMKLVETYAARPLKRGDIPLSAFAGVGDMKVTPGAMAAWTEFGNLKPLHVLAGGHFHALQNPQEVLTKLFADAYN